MLDSEHCLGIFILDSFVHYNALNIINIILEIKNHQKGRDLHEKVLKLAATMLASHCLVLAAACTPVMAENKPEEAVIKVVLDISNRFRCIR